MEPTTAQALTPGEPGSDDRQRSCIYEGTVVHWRRGEVDHAFQRRIYMLHLDLAELPDALEAGRLWSTHRRALARFDRSDHLGHADVPLDTAVRDLVEERTGTRPEGRITLLTQLRHLGIGFNPISVYYCHNGADTRVETLVAEVRNTPWLEMHCYVLPLPETGSPGAGSSRRTHRFECAKEFHVSPFMEMGYTYRWRVSEPTERLLLHIESWRDGERAFGATLRGRRRPLDAPTLRRMLVRYPLVSAQVIGGIYYEALRLWWKGVPFQSHPRWSEDGSGSDRAEPVIGPSR